MSSGRAAGGPGLASGSGAQMRERDALRRLAEVSRVRRLRLTRLRAALVEREREWDAAMARQREDEALLDDRRAQAAGRWKAWCAAGGTLADAARLREDRGLLAEIAALLLQRHQALMRRRESLDGEWAAWTRRWQAVQVFDDTLDGRRVSLRLQHEAAADRQRDEEALLVQAARRPVARVGQAGVGLSG